MANWTDNGNGSVTVKPGATLSAIASAYYKEYGYSSRLSYQNYLVERNNIKNANLIYVGQVIWLTGNSTPVTPSSEKKVKNLKLGQNAKSEREVVATWDFSDSKTDHYELHWMYSWGVGKAVSNKTTTTDQVATYSPPDYATKVSLVVTPVSKTYTEKVGDKEVEKSHWEGKASDRVLYSYSDNAPSNTPSAPDVEIEDYNITVSLDNIPDDITKVKFEIVKNNSSKTYAKTTVKVKSNHASYTTTIAAGGEYKARAKYVNDNGESEWSSWSGESGTKPSAPKKITECRAETETSVYLAWGSVENATSYDIEYATKKEYFDGSNQTSTESGVETSTYILGGLESGQEYFFRVRAVNGNGESGWTALASTIIGTEPAAPTTWSSTTTVITGEQLTLYWVHNSEDGSAQTKAKIELTIDGTTSYREIDTASEEDDEKTMYYAVPTSGYTEGVTILWRVQTAGATKNYGEWSVQRTVKIYAPPTLSINILDTSSNEVEMLESFPFRITGDAGPNTQVPVGYHLTIISNTNYETSDSIGIIKTVNEGDEVYSRYIDSSSYDLSVDLSAGDVDLVNNASYTAKCILSMDSGLTGEATVDFDVRWADLDYAPNAEIGIVTEDLTALIMPYCEDGYGELVENVKLSVYRREFDGTFTELITGLVNDRGLSVTDPHPALDHARYRIVAMSTVTGSISYTDLPGIPIQEKSVIIQWDEEWRPYENTEYPTGDIPWNGSMLKLPYNIDISESNTLDVSLVEYIGRRHPVSYYGTQVGQAQSWSVVIPKTDAETIYALRRLAVWMGDVYIREPSGSGYWANISVSFSQNHLETTIPVQFEITRVAGGM